MNNSQTKTLKSKLPLISYFSEVRSELTKVTWPDSKQVYQLSLIVIVVSVVTSIYLGLLDYTFTSILNAVVFN